MPYPRLRPLANRIRGVRAPLLYRFGLRRGAVEGRVTDAPLLVAAPHHDDETFGCGGLIALKRQLGIPVHVVFVTDGSQSHRDYQKLAQSQITESRVIEATKACELLGVPKENLHFLDGVDGELEELANVERNEMVHKLAQIITDARPGEIAVPCRKDCHPDHEATHALIEDAIDLANSTADLLEYPIWILWKRTLLDWTTRELAGAERLDVRSVQPIKDKAIAVYLSQLQGMPRGFVPQFQLGEEFFWRYASPISQPAEQKQASPGLS